MKVHGPLLYPKLFNLFEGVSLTEQSIKAKQKLKGAIHSNWNSQMQNANSL